MVLFVPGVTFIDLLVVYGFWVLADSKFITAVFFVISAYVLSVKPLTLIHAGDYEALSSNLGSALFRRWIRLHLPIIMVTFAYMTSWHLFGVWTLSPEHKATWGEEAWNWYCEFKNFSFAFRTGGVAWFTYNFPVWSIPVEFRGSIVVYTSLLAVSRATRNGRLWCYIGLMFYFFFIVDGWFAAIFVSGMMMCDLDLLAQKDQLPSFFNIVKRRKTLIYYGLFVFSLLLSGVPTHIADVQILQEAPFWRHMTWLKPEAAWDHKWIFLFISANCLVASIPRISWLKGFFETTFNQYLGRISFSLYLVHGPILWTLGDRLYAAAGWYKEGHEINIPQWIDTFPLPKWGPLGLEPCFLLPHIIILPFTLWMAEIVTKLVDEPSVRFANWFYRVTLPSTGSKVDEARLG